MLLLFQVKQTPQSRNWQGYQVNAFDLSEHGIAKVNDRCKVSGVKMNAFIADLTEYEFEQNYDVIISLLLTHLKHIGSRE